MSNKTMATPKSFVDALSATREAKLKKEGDCFSIILDTVEIMYIQPKNNYYEIDFLPDIWGHTDIEEYLDGEPKFTVVHADYIGVRVKTKTTDLEPIFTNIFDITRDVNVYGYTKE